MPESVPELELEDLMKPSVHYTPCEGEGWESDED